MVPVMSAASGWLIGLITGRASGAEGLRRPVRQPGLALFQLAWRSVPPVGWGWDGGVLPRNPGE